MPRQLLELNKFLNGTITTPDKTDTPNESASFSLNLDSVSKDGALSGVNVNSTVNIKTSDGSANVAVDVDKCKVIKRIKADNTTQEDVVAWEDDVNKIHLISNLESATPRLNSEDIVTNTSGTTYGTVPLIDVAMETNNKEVHVGLGKDQKPQWVGYTNHIGLTSGSNKFIIGDAEVKYPSSVPYLIKTVRAGNDGYVYGVADGGTQVFKINGITGALVSSSILGTFGNTKSIAGDPANGRLFVLDDSGTGTVFELNTTDLNTKTVTYTLPTSYPGPSSSGYTDIEYTSTNTCIWLAASYSNGVYPSVDTSVGKNHQLLWKFTRSGNTSTVTLTNMMPRLDTDGVTPGNWVEYSDEEDGVLVWNDYIQKDTYIAETYQISLVKHPSDNAAIYWLARYPNTGYSENSSEADYKVRWVHKEITSSNFSGSSNFDKVASVTSVRTLCLHRIKNNHNASSNEFVPLYNVYHPLGANNYISAPNQGVASFSALNVTSCKFDNDGDEFYLTIGDKVQKCSTNVDTSWTSSETSGNYNRYSLTSENAVSPTTETSYSVTPTGQATRTGISINMGYLPSTNAVGSSYSADTTNIVLLRQSGTAGFDKIAQTFANNATQTFFLDHSALSITVAEIANSAGELQSGYAYFYKTTLLFDGYQETPLSTETVKETRTNTKNSNVTLTINNYTEIPDRASHVKVYRAESTASGDTSPASVYRLVKSVSLSTGWASSGDTRSQTIVDNGIKGPSYEAESGLPETLTNTLPNYSLSTQLNNQHYIGKCSHPGFIEDASSYVFVSKTGKFDIFDWLLDFIKLPTIPTALMAFAGRIYAFDENNTYRLRGGTGLFIEDIFEGVGCLNDDAAVVTDFGMFFADNNNIYRHNGQSAEPIGEGIVRGDSVYSWQNRDTSYHTRAMYDAKRKSVYFTFKAGNNYLVWAWNITRERWDMLSFNDVISTTQPKGFYNLNDNTLNINNGAGIVNYLGGTNKRIWEWHSKDLTMGKDTQEKRIREILVPSQLQIAYKTDSTAPSSYTSLNDPAGDGNANTSIKKGTRRLKVGSKETKIRIGLKPTQTSAASSIDECTALGIMYKIKRSPS